MNSHLKTIVIWLVVIAAVVIGYNIFSAASTAKQPLEQSSFYAAVENGEVSEVTITGDQVGYEITGRFKTPQQGPSEHRGGGELGGPASNLSGLHTCTAVHVLTGIL